MLFELIDKLISLDQLHQVLNSRFLDQPISTTTTTTTTTTTPTNTNPIPRYIYIGNSPSQNILYSPNPSSNNPISLQQLIPRSQYLTIIRSQIDTLDNINIKIQCNQYCDIHNTINDIRTLFNKKLLSCQSHHQLLINNPRFSYNHPTNEQLNHYSLYYGTYLNQLWGKFMKYIQKSNIINKYEQQRTKDYQILFTNYKQYQHKFTSPNTQNKKSQQTSEDNKPNINKYTIFQDYTPNPITRSQQIIDLMQSNKIPQSLCSDNCICFNGTIPCPNILERIQCQHHNCTKSQLRRRSWLSCKYYDRRQMLPCFEAYHLFHQTNQYNHPCVLEQTKVFGIDSYTHKILYFLLPFHKWGNDQTKRLQFLEIVLIEQLAIQGGLLQAVFYLSGISEWKFYATVLLEKIQQISMMSTANRRSLLVNDRAPEPYPGVDYLCIHDKGLGIRNTRQLIHKGQLIGQFLGQILQPWRQQQKQTIISKQGNNIKQFYCIVVPTHNNQPRGIRHFLVDPQNGGNFTRSINHSCTPNCKVQIIVSQGKYHVIFIALRDIRRGEEITFDYQSVTDNYQEHLNSICLCSLSTCAGRYLRFYQTLNSPFSLEFLALYYKIQTRLEHIYQSCRRYTKTQELQTQRQELLKEGVNVLNDNSQDGWLTSWAHFIYKTFIATELNYKLQEEEAERVDKRRQERLLVLNSKISKIIYFIEKCGSNVPPLHKLAWKNMLELLNEPLLEKDRLQIGPASWKNIEAYLSNAMLIREILIAKARKVIKSDPPIFKKLVRTAFTFHKVVPTLYPHFSSPSIQVFNGQQMLQFKGHSYKAKDYTILKWMLNWGDIKQSLSDRTHINLRNFSSEIQKLCRHNLQHNQTPDLASITIQSLKTMPKLLRQISSRYQALHYLKHEQPNI